jgi:hypothetical protein
VGFALVLRSLIQEEMMAILAVVWIAARWMTGWRVASEDAAPRFEDEPADRAPHARGVGQPFLSRPADE